jgi:hypothetical protein
MSTEQKYRPGGDAEAISRISREYYGSLRNMFDVHGWPERGAAMMPAQQAHVAKTYGSVRAFERLHERSSSILSPMQSIYSRPPNVWLTSFHDFKPESWGFLGFTKETSRTKFTRESQPGVLVVVYGSKRAASPEHRGNVIGVLQCSHTLGSPRDFMSVDDIREKEASTYIRDKWNYAIKINRAWRVLPSSYQDVRQFAPDATSTGAWQYIGSTGTQLTANEAFKILKLNMMEVPVYGGTPPIKTAPDNALRLLAPSKAGPVSQSPFNVKESEGPKHLYIMKLTGDADTFLGSETHGHIIVKAGFSVDPIGRRDTLNSTFPNFVYKWEILHSGFTDGTSPYPSSRHALEGEQAMQSKLCDGPNSKSLGGEFFLAHPEQVSKAWAAGNLAARNFKE